MKHRLAANFFNLVQDALYQFRCAASVCFPRFISRPYPKGLLRDIRQSDPKLNAEHTPPADEHIDLYSVWAIEFYTPAHMDELLSRLEQLGWTQDESQNPVSWLKHRDTSQFSQAWMPLRPVIPPDVADPNVTGSLRADLPPNVPYAYVDMYCFTPSLVAIAIEFAFDEEYSSIFDDALRQERHSFVTAIPRGYRIHDPGTQRTFQVKTIRRATTRLITDWFSSNLPGLCSAGLLEGDFPTCEFVTSRKVKPFPTKRENDGTLIWYLRHLGLSHSYDSWESADMPDLRFQPSWTHRNNANYHSILSIHEGSWIKQDCPEGSRRDRESRLYRMHRKVAGMLGVWAIGVLLQGYGQHFSKLRNSEFLRETRSKSVIEALQRIGESVSYSLDIAAVTAELASLVRTKRPLGLEVESFVPRSDAPDYWWKGSLEQLIHKQVGENASWLRSMDTAVRDHLTQYGTILGIVEDIRLQKKVTFLTYAMLFLTIVLAILTFITVSDHFPWVRTMWNSLCDLLQVSRFL